MHLSHKFIRCIQLLVCIIVTGFSYSASAAEQTLEYEYDALGRLEVVKDNINGNRNYKYDKAGNRTNVTIGTSSSAASSTPTQAPICYAKIAWQFGSTLTMECTEATRPWDSIKTAACAQQCPTS